MALGSLIRLSAQGDFMRSLSFLVATSTLVVACGSAKSGSGSAGADAGQPSTDAAIAGEDAAAAGLVPDTTLTAHPAELANSAEATFAFTSTTPAVVFQCRMGGTPFADCTSPWTVTGLKDGAQTFAVRAVAGGLPDQSPAMFAWTVDTTPPNINTLRINLGAPRALSPHVLVSLAAPTAAWLEVGADATLTGANWQPFQESILWDLPVGDGGKILWARTRDEAGNVSDPKSASIVLDTGADPTPIPLLGPAPPVAEDPGAGALYATDRIILSLAEGISPSVLADKALSGLGAVVLAGLPELRVYVLAWPHPVDVDAQSATVAAWPEVQWAEREGLTRADALPAGHPNDGKYLAGEQWGLKLIGAIDAWNYLSEKGIPYGSKQVRVAIIDTGCEKNHPDLAANLDVGDYTGIPANLNQLLPGDPKLWPGPLVVDGKLNGHGTHVAGIIGAVADNGMDNGVIGVAGNVTLSPILAAQAIPSKGSSDAWFGAYEVLESVYRAAAIGADVVNMSFGLNNSNLSVRAITFAAKARKGLGMVVVQAAGNWAPPAPCEATEGVYAPAAVTEMIIIVAAVDKNAKKSAFSKYSSNVHISAPGGSLSACDAQSGSGDILSTVPGGTSNYMAGTSMATPHVAGAAALILSLDYALNGKRDLTAADVKQILMKSAKPIDAMNPGFEGKLGAGLLDVGAAVKLAACWKGMLACDDGNACNGAETCANGACIAGVAMNCKDGNPCTDDSCDKDGLCFHVANSAVCDDEDACTAVDLCQANVCMAGAAQNCDDGNACTIDGCDAATGKCTHKSASGGCNDGNACTKGDACAATVCAGKGAVSCDDANPCTNDACDPAVGCSHANNTAPCSDGNICTDGDVCKGGVCAGASMTCDDANACTEDLCAKGAGCVHATLFAGTYGGANDDEAASVVALQDGFVVAGFTNSKGGGKYDGWVVRVDAQGKKLWDKTFGGAKDEEFWSIVPFQDGLVCAGSTVSKGAGQDDFWLVRLDSQGTQLWEKTYGGSYSDHAYGLAALADGFAIVGGTVSKGAGNGDFWLVRTDAQGVKLWDKTFGGAQQDQATAVAALSDGFAIVGLTTSMGAAGVDILLVRTDANGNSLWNKTYGGAGDEETWVIKSVGEGFLIGGKTNSKGAGGDDIWLVKTDLAGNKVWDKTYGGPADDYLYGIAILPDGLALAGITSTKGVSGWDGWLAGTDLGGHLNWERKLGGTGSDGVSSLLATPHGLVLTGFSDSTGAGGNDAWLVRTDLWGHATCAEAGVCFGGPPPAGCEDGDACTTELCNAVVGCTAGAPLSCDDGNDCTVDTCNAVNGACTHKALDGSEVCSDGKACTIGDWCAAGVCQAGAAKVCTGTDMCVAGVCKAPPEGMVLIPDGTFWMGCNPSKDAVCAENYNNYYVDEGPQHKVTLSAYYMDVTEVTVTQYKACMAAGACTAPSANWSFCNSGVSGKEQDPVNCVDWTQSRQYCQWRGAGFDLPTEAQWEMAARGDCAKNGSTASDPNCKSAMRTYPWGETAATCTYAVTHINGGIGCNAGGTWPVGSKPAGDSPYGLHDMAGNVSEWTRDWYGNYLAKDQTDPTGPASAFGWVYRGGDFGGNGISVRSAGRDWGNASTNDSAHGVRCSWSKP